MLRTLRTACTLIDPRPTGPLVADRGSNLLLPLPQLVLSAAPKEESCGGKNLYWSAALCYSWRSRP